MFTFKTCSFQGEKLSGKTKQKNAWRNEDATRWNTVTPGESGGRPKSSGTMGDIDENESFVTYTNISRPTTVSTLRSEPRSWSSATNFAETVNSERQIRCRNSKSQRQELVRIFEQYSMCQLPIPPATPRNAGKLNYPKTQSQDGNNSGVPANWSALKLRMPPRGRRTSGTFRNKARSVKTEIKVIHGMQPAEEEEEQ
eukprot:gene8188-9066_t